MQAARDRTSPLSCNSDHHPSLTRSRLVRSLSGSQPCLKVGLRGTVTWYQGNRVLFPTGQILQVCSQAPQSGPPQPELSGPCALLYSLGDTLFLKIKVSLNELFYFVFIFSYFEVFFFLLILTMKNLNNGVQNTFRYSIFEEQMNVIQKV